MNINDARCCASDKPMNDVTVTVNIVNNSWYSADIFGFFSLLFHRRKTCIIIVVSYCDCEWKRYSSCRMSSLCFSGQRVFLWPLGASECLWLQKWLQRVNWLRDFIKLSRQHVHRAMHSGVQKIPTGFCQFVGRDNKYYNCVGVFSWDVDISSRD